MNWFERYGIAGAYFIALATAWLYAFNPNSAFWTNFWADQNIKYITVIGGVLLLPVGYIVSVFSQFIYYRIRILSWPFFPQIHKDSIKEGGFKQFRFSTDKTEDTVESDMTIRYRLAHSNYANGNDDRLYKRFENLQRFLTKRWDVLAINQILMVSTFLAPIMSWVTLWSLRLNYSPNVDLCYFLATVSVLILVAFCLSQRVLSKQLVRTYEQMHIYFESTTEGRFCRIDMSCLCIDPEWVMELKGCFDRRYPQVMKLLKVKKDDCPAKVYISTREEIKGAAKSGRDKIEFTPDVGQKPSDPKDKAKLIARGNSGFLTHEATHVVQSYSSNIYNDKNEEQLNNMWIAEGIADYVRHKLGWDDFDKPNEYPCKQEECAKADCFLNECSKCAARFLVHLEEKFSDNALVIELNKALQSEQNADEFIANRFKKSLEELHNEYKIS